MNFTLFSNSNDELRDLYHCLNQKMITAINISDGFRLGDNLIRSKLIAMSVQVDYMSSAFVPVEFV